MGTITRASDITAGINCLRLSRRSMNPASGGFYRSLCPCKLSRNVPRSFHRSLAPNRGRWLSHKASTTGSVSREKLVRRKLADESSFEALATEAVKFFGYQTVFAVVLSTVLGGTPARAGVESTLQPKFSGLVDASANKVSSVEAILAKQLARRFREMSDEELILVLQELLKASRSSISPEDLVFEGKGRTDVARDRSKEDSRKPVDAGPSTQYPFSEAKQESEASNGVPELSASDSKLVDPISEIGEKDSHRSVDDIGRASEPKEGEGKTGGRKIPVLRSNSVNQGPNAKQSVLPDTMRAPSLGKESASDGALEAKNSRSSASATEEQEDANEFSERTERIGESENQDMTGILWDEWRRRLESQTVQEPTNSEESNVVSGATDVWQKIQKSSKVALEGAVRFSAWIRDNREAVGGGFLASGSIFLVLFIRQKILSLASNTENRKSGDIKPDRNPTNAQLPASNVKSSGQDPWGFMQAMPTTLRAAGNRLLGSEERAAEVEKTPTTASSGSSSQSTTAGLDYVPSNGESGPAIGQSGDDMDPKRQEAREKLTDLIQNSSGASFLRPSEALPDRFTSRIDDRQGNGWKSGPITRLKTALEFGDAINASGVDGYRTSESSYLQGRKSGKEDAVDRIRQFSPSIGTAVNDSSKIVESPTQEEKMTRYKVENSPVMEERVSPRTSNMNEERNSPAKSFRGSVGGSTIRQRREPDSWEKVPFTRSERRRDIVKINSFQSGNSQSVEFEDRFTSANKVEEGVSSSEGANGESRKSGLGDGWKRGPSSEHVAHDGERASDSVGSKGSPQRNEDSVRFESNLLRTDPLQKTRTEATTQNRIGSEDPVPDDLSIAKENDGFSVQDGAGDSEQAPTGQREVAGGAAKFMDTQTEGFDFSTVSIQGSGVHLPYSTSEQSRDGLNISKSIPTWAPDTPRIYPESTRESLEVREEVLNGKVAAAPESGEQILLEEVRVEGKMSSRSPKNRLLKSEVKEDWDPARGSASNADVGDINGDINRVDVWASGEATVSGAKSFSNLQDDVRNYKADGSGTGPQSGKDFESKRASQSVSQLDSFVHNQQCWVRDNDGVFMKQPIATQGTILDKDGSKVPGNVSRLKNDSVHVKTPSKGAFTKSKKDANTAAQARLQKQRSISSGFDYRQLYLMPSDEKNTPSENFEFKGPWKQEIYHFPEPFR